MTLEMWSVSIPSIALQHRIIGGPLVCRTVTKLAILPLEEKEGMHPADAAVPIGVTRNLEGERRRHEKKDSKNRCEGTLESHQAFLSAQICRSGRTLNNAQPVSGPNLVTDQAVEEDTWQAHAGGTSPVNGPRKNLLDTKVGTSPNT